MRKGICNCLVFYDIAPEQVDVQGWYEYCMEFFQQYNQVPDRASISGENIPQSRSTKTFKYCNKLLHEKNFKGITDIWFASHPPVYHNDYSDMVFSAEFILDTRGSSSGLYFDNEVAKYNKELVLKHAHHLATYLNAGYGIFHQRDFDKGPNWYTYGVIGNEGYSKIEEDLIARWFHIYKDPKYYQHGDLRDIYPMNFISEAHLKRQVGNKTLEEWIQETDKHGLFSPLTDKLWTWEVPKEDIEHVREGLRDTGIVKCI